MLLFFILEHKAHQYLMCYGRRLFYTKIKGFKGVEGRSGGLNISRKFSNQFWSIARHSFGHDSWLFFLSCIWLHALMSFFIVYFWRIVLVLKVKAVSIIIVTGITSE